MTGDGLGDEEGAAEVGFKDKIPVVPGDVQGGFADVAAGIVDEDVDLREGHLGGLRHVLNAGLISDVQTERDGATAHGLKLCHEGEKILLVAAGEDEVRACAGESRGQDIDPGLGLRRSRGLPGR